MSENMVERVGEEGVSDVLTRAKAAALVALAEHGSTTDIQELLVRGSRTLPPGAIDKMVRAVLESARDPTEGMKRAGHGALDESEASEYAVGARVGWAAIADVWNAMLTAALKP